MSTTKPIRNKSQLNYFRNYYKNIEYNPRNYALIVLGLNSALRIGDLLTLHWNDIYNEHEKKYRKHITLIEKKTGKINTLLLNKSSREALELHRQTQTPMHSNGNDFVFQSQKSPYHNISRSQAFHIIKKAASSCQLDDTISCHSLRKTFGYHAWKDGVQPALLMSIYNHSSYEITKRYLGIDQLEKDEVYRKISL